jgi:threonine dehydrogenase-like Zn-dependent dehydrogenase
MKSKGVMIEKPGQLKIMESEVVEPQGSQVLLKVNNIGICGSDIHLFYGSYTGPHGYPLYFGHEWSGTVIRKGRKVKNLNIGDVVTGDCSIYCGHCEYCKQDKNLCENIQKFGITINGASREYFLQEEKYLYKLPENLSPDLASLAEPVAVAAHGVEKLGDISDKKILVLGAGPIGLSVLMVLKKIHKAKKVELFDLIDFRRKLAENLGAKIPDNLDLFKEELQIGEKYKDFYSEFAYDIIIESSGSPKAFNNALNLVKPLGTILNIGFIPRSEISFRLVTLKAIRLMGSIGGTGNFPQVLQFLKDNQGYASSLVTHKFPFQNAQEAFKLSKKDTRAIKIQLSFKENQKQIESRFI